MAPVFDIEEFVKGPTLAEIDACRKEDLHAIAFHYKIPVPKSAGKDELKTRVLSGLVVKNILVVLPGAQDDVVSIPEGGPSAGAHGDAHIGGGARALDHQAGPESGQAAAQVHVQHGGGRGLLPVPDGTMETKGEVEVRIAQMQLQQQLQIEQARLEHELKLQQLQADTTVRLRQLELAQGGPPTTASATGTSQSGVTTSGLGTFDVAKHLAFVPTFRESEVDCYFQAFERIAGALKWPRDVWALLLQCKVTGRALDAISALPLHESLEYDAVKAAILASFELVPEAYRQKFRNNVKKNSQSCVEFAREKAALFDKWCSSCKVTDFKALRELILLEEFKRRMPDRIVMYLNEQKVETLSQASILADEYALTHRNVFFGSPDEKAHNGKSNGKVQPARNGSVASNETSKPSNVPRKDDKDKVCFACHKPGHLIANCSIVKREKQQAATHTATHTQGVGLIKTEPVSIQNGDNTDSCFAPFMFDGFVSLTGDPNDQQPVRILRDTGGSQSIILAGVLPLNEQTSCGYSTVLRGIEMGYVPRALHRVHIQSKLVTGSFPVAVCPELPIKGISFLMGNDIAGGRVTPSLEVLDSIPLTGVPEGVTESPPIPNVYPACVITRAQAAKLSDVVDLSDSILGPAFRGEKGGNKSVKTAVATPIGAGIVEAAVKVPCATGPENVNVPKLPMTRQSLISAQKSDASLKKCFKELMTSDAIQSEQVGYYLDNDILMRKWSPLVDAGLEWSAVFQIVVPTAFRQQVLSVAHESKWAGHFGVAKTYNLLLKHFFWPGMKSDVAKFCQSCHTCQLVGKPNQVIPPAPLYPIPVIGEPFERVVVDCVGPLPKTASGNQYLLTIMCAATRFPEAIPLRSITAKAVVKALHKFFAIFGLAKFLQSDQGTNFQSKLFNQVLDELNIEHKVASAWHPESQGCLERWHQTLKSMLRKYCIENERDWDEGIPFVLFAARDAVQDSLGFSPAELVFGHTVRGPLKVLKEQFLSTPTSPGSGKNVLDYVSKFRERFHRACTYAQDALSDSQVKMKRLYDRAAVSRLFQPGDKVMVLLPILGSALSARFEGPFDIIKKLSATDYVISTPERRRKTRVCHV